MLAHVLDIFRLKFLPCLVYFHQKKKKKKEKKKKKNEVNTDKITYMFNPFVFNLFRHFTVLT